MHPYSTCIAPASFRFSTHRGTITSTPTPKARWMQQKTKPKKYRFPSHSIPFKRHLRRCWIRDAIATWHDDDHQRCIAGMSSRGQLAEDFRFGALAEPAPGSPISLPFLGTRCTNGSSESSGSLVERGPVPGFWIRRCLHETYREAYSLCTVRDLRTRGSFRWHG